MGDRKRKLSSAAKLERGQVVTLFEELLAGLRCGELALDNGDPQKKGVTLRPSETLKVELEAKIKGSRESLSVELSWKRPKPGPVEVEVKAAPLEPGPDGPEPSSKVEGAAPSAAPAEPAEELELDALELDEREPGEQEESQAAAAPVSARSLMGLSRARLYALAKTFQIPGRSSLPKVALARELAKLDLSGELDPKELA